MSKGILLYAEITPKGYINPVFFELASKANELSKKMGDCEIFAVLFTNLPNDFKEGFTNNGIDKVYVFEGLKTYSTEIYSKMITELVKEIEPEIFLIGATNQGRDLAPRISSALKTGLTADCIELDINEQGKLCATRPTFGGKLMATILSKTNPQMATVRPKVFKPSESAIYKETEFIVRKINDNEFVNNVEIIDFKPNLDETNELDSANIIIAGGKGMKNKDGFELLQKLANLTGGTVGATRGAVDAGYAPKNIQIGQTGKTVCPDLYIACGISGAVQHTCGMINSKKIIAINLDKNAPIFEVADIGIVGDTFEILPALIEKLYIKNSEINSR